LKYVIIILELIFWEGKRLGALKGLGWTFDTTASAYEKLRPGYSEELYQKIFEYCNIDDSSNIVEVGIGGGQATLPILKTGGSITAVEYGENLAQICKEKFKDFSNFHVITSKFEDVDFKGNTYDLVYSASAFHWVPEDIGYQKVYSMLKKGGTFARFANNPFLCKKEPELFNAIEDVYAKYYYKYYNKTPEVPKEYSKEDAKRRAFIAEKYGFKDIQYALFYRTRTFSAKQYTELLGTYSDHIAMEENMRNEFFAKIEETINAHGGPLIIYDTMDLQLARK